MGLAAHAGAADRGVAGRNVPEGFTSNGALAAKPAFGHRLCRRRFEPTLADAQSPPRILRGKPLLAECRADIAARGLAREIASASAARSCDKIPPESFPRNACRRFRPAVRIDPVH